MDVIKIYLVLLFIFVKCMVIFLRLGFKLFSVVVIVENVLSLFIFVVMSVSIYMINISV